MAGLSSFLSDTTTKATTLPSWYDSAQQQIASNAKTATAAMPALQNTLAGNAINQLGGANNPFAQAGATAQQIASGAANPFSVSATGQVTPNTGTALGGLFQAQNQQLQQLMPNIKAAPEAGAIASGNFGSLRGQTAVEKALGDAQANLFAQQNQAALNNQQTGVAAAGQAGTLANQNITNQTALGQLQQMDPTMQAATYAKLIGAINNVPTSVTQSAQLSPLSQIGALAGGTQTANDILKSLGYSAGLGGVGQSIMGGLSNLISGGGGTSTPVDANTVAAGGSGGGGTFTPTGGNSFNIDTSGNNTNTQVPYNPADANTSGNTIDTSGGSQYTPDYQSS